ncbi:MAG: hypothetical protein SCALA702_06220 [Melioribacteraceae bacterium]|nr:MAG: hypothetical protein SCALA702_06220 [Melioribacteraceae bacterium]
MIARLVDCKKGTKVRVSKIAAGRGAILNLMNMGVVVGNVIEVGKSSQLHGPVLVKYQESDIAIGYGLAEKIIVEGIESGIYPDWTT